MSAIAASSKPAWVLLLGASFWGIAWYPYRLLVEAGLDGIWATLASYGLALAIGVALFPAHARAAIARLSPLAVLMGAAIGWSNLAYVLGVVEGEVMRVLLLFYLAPLWTVPIARVVLGERLDARGGVVMALALAGAVVMLWHPELGLPWPASRAEWFGVAAGFLFALGNVLVRRLEEMSDPAKSIVIWAGVTFAACVHLGQSAVSAAQAWGAAASTAPVLVGLALVLVAMSLAIQYGLSRLPANRAIVILLFELVVAAVASWFLAGERLRPQDWAGGFFIVLATLASALAPPRRAH